MAKIEMDISEYESLKKIEEDLRASLKKQEELQTEIEEKNKLVQQAQEEKLQALKDNEDTVTFIEEKETEILNIDQEGWERLAIIGYRLKESGRLNRHFHGHLPGVVDIPHDLRKDLVHIAKSSVKKEEKIYSKHLRTVKAEIRDEVEKEVQEELNEMKAYKEKEYKRIQEQENRHAEKMLQLERKIKELEQDKELLNNNLDSALLYMENLKGDIHAVQLDLRGNNYWLNRKSAINTAIQDLDRLQDTIEDQMKSIEETTDKE